MCDAPRAAACGLALRAPLEPPLVPLSRVPWAGGGCDAAPRPRCASPGWRFPAHAQVGSGTAPAAGGSWGQAGSNRTPQTWGGFCTGETEEERVVRGNETIALGQHPLSSAQPVLCEDAEHRAGSGPGWSLLWTPVSRVPQTCAEPGQLLLPGSGISTRGGHGQDSPAAPLYLPSSGCLPLPAAFGDGGEGVANCCPALSLVPAFATLGGVWPRFLCSPPAVPSSPRHLAILRCPTAGSGP